MTTLSLREAARTTGASRSTLLRRIQAGRLPAVRTEEGVYAIDPDELLRVCPPKADEDERSSRQVAMRGTNVVALQPGLELRLHTTRLEAEVEALQAALEAEKRRSEELREERDRWHAQAERLAAKPIAERPVERGLGFLRWMKTQTSDD